MNFEMKLYRITSHNFKLYQMFSLLAFVLHCNYKQVFHLIATIHDVIWLSNLLTKLQFSRILLLDVSCSTKAKVIKLMIKKTFILLLTLNQFVLASGQGVRSTELYRDHMKWKIIFSAIRAFWISVKSNVRSRSHLTFHIQSTGNFLRSPYFAQPLYSNQFHVCESRWECSHRNAYNEIFHWVKNGCFWFKEGKCCTVQGKLYIECGCKCEIHSIYMIFYGTICESK